MTSIDDRVVKVLEGAKALILEKGWGQGAFARDGEGNSVDAYHRGARCYCTLGAIYKAGRRDPSAASTAVSKFREFNVGDAPNVAKWNDAPERTKSDVIKAFDEAIALLRK